MIIRQTGLKEIFGKDNFHAEEESEIEEYIQSAFPTPGPSPLLDMTGGVMGPMGYHSLTKIASPSLVVDRLIPERRPSGHLKNYVVATPTVFLPIGLGLIVLETVGPPPTILADSRGSLLLSSS